MRREEIGVFLKITAVPLLRLWSLAHLLGEPQGRGSSGRGYGHLGPMRPGRKGLFEEPNMVGSNGAAQS